jgi:O-antigen/teichoic acid export membrane protein
LLPSFKGISAGFDTALWRRMMHYSLPLLLAGMAGMVNETMDRILLKYLLPPETAMEQVGIYGACYKLSILMTLFIQMFRYAAEPFFFKQAKEDNAKQVYADVMKYFVIACSFIFLGIMMYIDLVKFFIGEKYYPGLQVVPVLLLANLCLGVFFNLSIWYKLSGKTSYGAWLAVFGATLTLVLNAWWIPLFGYVGSAWATLACYASMMLVSFYLGQKNYPVPYELTRIVFYLGSALALYFAASYVRVLVHGNLIPVLAFNSLLLILFAALVYRQEKAKIL